METITFTKREYSELLGITRDLERILEAKKKRASLKKDTFLRAFGILRDSIKGESVDYISKLRKKWR